MPKGFLENAHEIMSLVKQADTVPIEEFNQRCKLAFDGLYRDNAAHLMTSLLVGLPPLPEHPDKSRPTHEPAAFYTFDAYGQLRFDSKLGPWNRNHFMQLVGLELVPSKLDPGLSGRSLVIDADLGSGDRIVLPSTEKITVIPAIRCVQYAS